MAQYMVTDTELKAVADAIRLKGGTSADLEWTSGYVAAIRAISGGGGGNLYTNGYAPTQITSVSGFTKLANTSVQYGNSGAKVLSNLDVTDESTLDTRMNGGWNSSYAAYYDRENLTGAYGGYDFGSGLSISMAKFWLGRYSGQNKTLIATIETLDSGGNWNEETDLEITTTIPYPNNVFTVWLGGETVYGLRWIHKKSPQKSSNNNIVFFGMTIYGEDQSKPVYVPASVGLIEPPVGYDGFGPLYLP